MPPLYARELRTDDQGTYKVSGIPAGRYRIAAGYQPVVYATLFGRVGYGRTFYPDAADEAHASVIEIAAGSEVTNVNINLGHPVKTFSVSARIVDSQNGKPVEDIDYGLDVFSNGKRIGGAHPRGRSNSRGEITIDNVPPGEYSIRVPGGSGLHSNGHESAGPHQELCRIAKCSNKSSNDVVTKGIERNERKVRSGNRPGNHVDPVHGVQP